MATVSHDGASKFELPLESVQQGGRQQVNRIKLSRELMVRLTAALGEHLRARTEQEEEEAQTRKRKPTGVCGYRQRQPAPAQLEHGVTAAPDAQTETPGATSAARDGNRAARQQEQQQQVDGWPPSSVTCCGPPNWLAAHAGADIRGCCSGRSRQTENSCSSGARNSRRRQNNKLIIDSSSSTGNNYNKAASSRRISICACGANKPAGGCRRRRRCCCCCRLLRPSSRRAKADPASFTEQKAGARHTDLCPAQKVLPPLVVVGSISSLGGPPLATVHATGASRLTNLLAAELSCSARAAPEAKPSLIAVRKAAVAARGRRRRRQQQSLRLKCCHKATAQLASSSGSKSGAKSSTSAADVSRRAANRELKLFRRAASFGSQQLTWLEARKQPPAAAAARPQLRPMSPASSLATAAAAAAAGCGQQVDKEQENCGRGRKHTSQVDFSVGLKRGQSSIYLLEQSKQQSLYSKQAEISNFNKKTKKSSVIQKQHQLVREEGCQAKAEGSPLSSSSPCFVVATTEFKAKPKQSNNKLVAASGGRVFRSNELPLKRLRRKREQIASAGELQRDAAKSKALTTTTTTCETSKCDSHSGVAAAGWKGRLPKWGHRRTSLVPSKGSTLLWPALLAALWLLVGMSPSGSFTGTTIRVPAVSGLQLESVDGGTGSDELSRAVLATMSTRSPLGRRLDELSSTMVTATPNATTPFAMQTTTASDPMAVDGQQSGVLEEAPDVFERLLAFGRIFIMCAIIVGDICGNSLVILSVCRHSKLRVTTNWFVVSLACADILVALFAMTFNASVIISGRWLFKPWVCDFWNSCDVLASTASILHLCCISIDRYIAIMRPLDYPMKITTRRVVYALCGVWISSALLSYIPIFAGIYTTAEHIKWLKDNPDQCEFVVNRVYAIVSSSISFWIPCCIMVFTYYRIYREATRQEKFMLKAQCMMPAPINHHTSNHHSSGNQHNRSKQRRSKSVAVPSAGSGSARLIKQQQQHQLKPAKSGAIATTDLNSSGSVQAISAAGQPAAGATARQLDAGAPAQASSLQQLEGAGSGGAGAAAEAEPLAAAAAKTSEPSARSMCVVAFDEKRKPGGRPQRPPEEEDDDEDEDPVDESNSGQSTPTKRSISKMKREHKAAKTLGIIMGVFILCWLPFFSWYTPMHICGHACDGIVPRGAVTILFWIGYFNSTLNPIIYAYFNHEFRDAFKKTLQWIFCCCQDLKCLRVNRPNDNQHYNCTYRSTQEIGLVSNS